MPYYPPAASGSGAVAYSANSDPGAANDNTQGYSVGSMGVNTSTGRAFIAQGVATGVAVWEPIAAAYHPGYVASNWYLPFPGSVPVAGAAATLNVVRAFPGVIASRITISTLGVRITTTGASGNIQAAIYNNSGTTGRPSTLVMSSASMSTTSNAAVTGAVNSGTPVQIEPGIYWFCTNQDNSSSAQTSIGVNGSGLSMPQLLGSATQANVAVANPMIQGITTAMTFNTWSTLVGASWTDATTLIVPLVEFLVSSVP